MKNTDQKNMLNQPGKVWAGMFIVVVGALLLLGNIGLDLPEWIFRWHTFLLLLGLFIGFKHGFKDSGWLVLVLIGTFFTLKRAIPELDMSRMVFPIMLLILGAFLILKPKRNYPFRRRRRFMDQEDFSSYTEVKDEPVSDQRKTQNNDYIDSVNVFGGSHQAVYSKNFKGGEITAVFGGCDVNLTQADFEGQIKIEVTAIFGGAKIIIPPGWEVKSEVTAIFGGLDDKRAIQPLADDAPRKVLIIEGLALFGGVDIRNY